MRKFVDQIKNRESAYKQKDEEKESKEKEQHEQEDEQEHDENTPDIERSTHKIEHDIFEMTIYYKNGDEETIIGYGEHDRNEDIINLTVDKQPEYKSNGWISNDVRSVQKDIKSVHPAYLSRDIEFNKIDTEIWEMEIAKKKGTDSMGYPDFVYKIENFSSYRSVDKYK